MFHGFVGERLYQLFTGNTVKIIFVGEKYVKRRAFLFL